MGLINRPQPWKYGDIKPVVGRAPVSTAVKIAKGDMVAQAAGSITGATSAAAITIGTTYPASDQPWDTSLAVTQEAFHDAFLGVSQTQVNEQNPVPKVATKSVQEFDCASATFKIGDLVGPAKATGDNLEDQKVVAVATPNLAIGKIAVDYPTAVTKVWVEIFSTIMEGGVQAMA